MPTAFTIPAKAYSAIEILLPRQFNVQFDRDSFSVPDRWIEGNVLSYDHYAFRLAIAETNESEIVGIYLGRGKMRRDPHPGR
jgi:hypothetical protein